jgi:hypothetical protein
MSDKRPTYSGPVMSKEAAREIADGSCRDEDEKAYGRPQVWFAPPQLPTSIASEVLTVAK